MKFSTKFTSLLNKPQSSQQYVADVTATIARVSFVIEQILTGACVTERGHRQVMEAMSRLRIQLGENVRFKLLVGMLNSAGESHVSFQVICSYALYL